MRKNILFLLALTFCWSGSSSAGSLCNRQKGDVKTAVKPETNYLNFLYKYMALPDKTDYSKAFYEENIALTLQARREMPWGKTIPEREFKHFVLPVRVNNENLDDSRKVFYAELKNRVKHLSMKDAILEVNHWCHEKVTYRPTD
ncbi:MAG: transglutaminase domain-containing protein, partial [Prevotella intermedia]